MRNQIMKLWHDVPEYYVTEVSHSGFVEPFSWHDSSQMHVHMVVQHARASRCIISVTPIHHVLTHRRWLLHYDGCHPDTVFLRSITAHDNEWLPALSARSSFGTLINKQKIEIIKMKKETERKRNENKFFKLKGRNIQNRAWLKIG